MISGKQFWKKVRPQPPVMNVESGQLISTFSDSDKQSLEKQDVILKKLDQGLPPKYKLSSVRRIIAKAKDAQENGKTSVCNFKDRTLVNIDFTSIPALIDAPDILRGADFSGAVLVGCSFGPKMLPNRTQNREIPEAEWQNIPSIDLTEAVFKGAHLHDCTFSGANITLAVFEEARISRCHFDLVFAASGYSWELCNFDNTRIENSYFRGACMRGSFTGAKILKTDFTPADLPVYDVKKVDSRIERLANPVAIHLSVSDDALAELIDTKADEVKSYSDRDDKPTRLAWRAVFSAILSMFDHGAMEIPLRNIIRTQLDESNFENSFIYSCAFRAARMEREVKFDRAVIMKTDFRAARIEELPWQSSIVSTLFTRVTDAITAADAMLIHSQLEWFLRQIAEKIEDEAEVRSREARFDNEGGLVATRMKTCSFDEIVAEDVHFDDAHASKVQLTEAIVADAYFENADLTDSDFSDAVIKRTTFDDANLSGAKAVNTRFDGNLVDSQKILKIDYFHDYFKSTKKLIDNEIDANRDQINNLSVGKNDTKAAADESGGDYGPDEDGESENDFDSPDVLQSENSFQLYYLSQETWRLSLEGAAVFFHRLQLDADKDAVGAETREFIIEQGASDACSFTNANLSKINAAGSSFKACALENSIFKGAMLGRGDLRRGAVFDYAFLRSADFSDAVLEHVSFLGATLTGMTGLKTAQSLAGASFHESKGLSGTEFSGADLTSVTLPDKLNRFGDILHTVTELTRQARVLFATLMFVCAYSLLTMMNMADQSVDITAENTQRATTDNSLLGLSDPSQGVEAGSASGYSPPATGVPKSSNADSAPGFKLPVIGVEVSRKIFYFVSPAMVFAFFVMFHLKFSRIWLEAKWLPHRFSDGRLVDRHLFPWIFASLIPHRLEPTESWQPVAGQTHRFSEMAIANVEKALAYTFGWVVVPATLYQFSAELIRLMNRVPIEGPVEKLEIFGISALALTQAFLVLALVVSLITLLQFFTILPTIKLFPSHSGQDDNEESSSLFAKTKRKWALLQNFFLRVVSRIRQLFIVGAAAIVVGVVALAPANLPRILVAASNDIDDTNLSNTIIGAADLIGFSQFSLSPDNSSSEWAERNLYFISGLNSNLSGVNFGGSHIIRARLAGANLQEADFSKTTLVLVDFTNANLSGASFQSSRLLSVDFTGANGLSPAVFEGACVNNKTILPESIINIPTCTPDDDK